MNVLLIKLIHLYIDFFSTTEVFQKETNKIKNQSGKPLIIIKNYFVVQEE